MNLTQPTNRPNLNKLVTQDYTVYFSYETAIAFHHHGDNTIYISDNEWGVTTGRHINHVKKNNPYFMQIPHDDLLQVIQDKT